MIIIDLLNKIANNEELPKAFVYNDKLWRLASNGTYFIGNDYGYDFWLAHGDDKFEDEPIKLNELNNKVEIIEEEKVQEEKKIPEKSNIDFNTKLPVSDCSENEAFMMTCISHLGKTIDSLIDYLKSKEKIERKRK